MATAWVLSPINHRHPYLWFATVPVLAGVGIERLRLSGVENGVMSIPKGEVEVNGEVVRAGVDDWRRWGLVRGGIIGSGFLVALVGLYGDFA
jgi:autophagy-related protein 33